MKEFDFDELDKAVGSALASSGPTTLSEPVSSVADTTPTTNQNQTPGDPVPTTPSQPPETATQPEPAAPTPAVNPTPAPRPTPAVTPTRRSGRFMDVVHPGANTSAPKPSVTADISRTAPSVQPSNGARVTQDVTAPMRPPAVSEPVKAVEPQNRVALDNLEAPTKPEETSVISNNQPQPQSQPTFSPFLTDAKVEKRPLGAFSTPSKQTEGLTDDANQELPAEGSGEQPQPPSAELPPELNTEVVALEAKDELDEEAPNLANTSQGASLSIPQQYAPAPADNNDSPHQVFDTEQYHPALTTATQNHKHTWAWVTLAVVILLVAAGIFGYWFVSGL